MYVVPEDQYNALINNSIQSQSTPIRSPLSPLQSHSTFNESTPARFRCNICKKSFDDEHLLRMHLKAHKPQAGEDADIQRQRTEYPTEVRYGVKLYCPMCNKFMKHKRNLIR